MHMKTGFWTIDIRRCLFNGGMLISVGLSLLILFQSYSTANLFSLIHRPDCLSITIQPLALSGYIPFACFFAIFPYAFSYLEEYNSGYIRSILLRMDSGRYIWHKITAVSLAGGTALVIPFFAAFLFAVLWGQPVSNEYYPQIYESIMWGKYMFIAGGKLVLFLRLLLIFIFGVVWSEAALLISVIFPNRYVTFIIPFVIYQILWMILPGSVFNPVLLFRADFPYECPIWLPYLVQLCAAVLLAFLIETIFKRKQVA